jgi:hypothetical protein
MPRAPLQVRTLEGVVEREAVPKDDANLCALSKARLLAADATQGGGIALKHASCPERRQLLAFAVGTRDLLEQRQMVVLNRDVLEKFYPLLADVILEVRVFMRLPCAAPRAAHACPRAQAQLRDSDDEVEAGVRADARPVPSHRPQLSSVALQRRKWAARRMTSLSS